MTPSEIKEFLLQVRDEDIANVVEVKKPSSFDRVASSFMTEGFENKHNLLESIDKFSKLFKDWESVYSVERNLANKIKMVDGMRLALQAIDELIIGTGTLVEGYDGMKSRLNLYSRSLGAKAIPRLGSQTDVDSSADLPQLSTTVDPRVTTNHIQATRDLLKSPVVSEATKELLRRDLKSIAPEVSLPKWRELSEFKESDKATQEIKAEVNKKDVERTAVLHQVNDLFKFDTTIKPEISANARRTAEQSRFKLSADKIVEYLDNPTRTPDDYLSVLNQVRVNFENTRPNKILFSRLLRSAYLDSIVNKLEQKLDGEVFGSGQSGEVFIRTYREAQVNSYKVASVNSNIRQNRSDAWHDGPFPRSSKRTWRARIKSWFG